MVEENEVVGRRKVEVKEVQVEAEVEGTIVASTREVKARIGAPKERKLWAGKARKRDVSGGKERKVIK